MAFKGKIQIRKAKWGPQCTLSSNLTENQMKRPVVRDFLEHADKRSISTLLTSGSVGPYGIGYVDTKIGKVDSSKKIGSNAYQFDIMGRIFLPSTINSQVGATLSDGTFRLSIRENYLYPGMNVVFNGGGFQARVQGSPTGADGNWVYTFKSIDGTAFVWGTHVALQGALKTCMGGYSSYGEKSLRGYGRTHFSDAFIVHMTTQRKSIGISGDAASDVLWYEYKGETGTMKGWRYEAEQQNKAQFTMENEFQKWDGKSSMKNDDGTLRTRSRLIDDETGNDIVTGDGIMEQLYGGNETYGSGTNGFATADDFADMLASLRKKSNMIDGNVLVMVTGEDGMRNAQREMPTLAGSQNVQLVQLVTQTANVGGAEVNVGFKYMKFNVDGDQIIFVKHSMFDNSDLYTDRGSDNKLIKSGQYVALTMEVDGRKNVEILSKGAYGIDRSMLEIYLNGLTGIQTGGNIVSEEDALVFAMLRQDLIVVYNTTVCGIIHKSRS
ncbi:MAG: hypothetical protein IT212_07650 [Bacteroidia bacterium]|nr:hypothetical protein [Bacteroidia bacterium]